ncbi:DUF5060 domain-containing protein [Tamlana sp. 2_MG-2023]|uniref:DUF5060 domain-containing protein n=1 Tax=unclassified Tamlana TaxID=2614803 RepID=UPI0026E1B3D9|nr:MULTISPECIES: DUF5060 domain-containing protein [unclassified Tamlana]MDO6761498.1 DUF5060 domain-containing protein [Tamlana sp. 2_MG-2023]MDO6792327.1 DUF5060 domain-containing protein [Tamlana sp. 1_MG-2023]
MKKNLLCIALFFALFTYQTKANEITSRNAVIATTTTANLGDVTVTGELKQWHNITLEITGPQTSESANTNPFSDYRVQVVFTKGNEEFSVPAYFAADGNAGETSATSGNIWKVHFRPSSTGTWNYKVHFRTGTDAATSTSNTVGTAVQSVDGKTGTIVVAASDKTGKDLRAKGRLEYVGEHYLRFAGNGEWFLKAGPDSPENFLAYEDFDNTSDIGGRRKSWSPHAGDWNSGDPSWQNGKGKEIIGAVNYLADKGLNTFSFLTMAAPAGDDKNVFMWTATNEQDRYDCSKLDQWEIVFTHGERKGMHLHFKTSETENEMQLDNGNVGRTRKIYYRELIARFGHHLALNWNLGEENGDYGNTNQNDAQRIAMAKYFADNDPYENHIVIHTSPNGQDKIYTPLLGNKSELTGASVQTGWNKVHDMTKTWVDKSANNGKKWVVANDEQNSAKIGVPEDAYTGTPNKHDIRENVLWGNFMAGGAGVEYYFGYERPHSDLNCEDFRSRDDSWDYCRFGLQFFNQYVPFWEMKNDNSKTSRGQCFYKDGDIYVIYLPNGGGSNVTLPNGNYNVRWYNPKSGAGLTDGKQNFSANGATAIGNSPNTNNDWVALVTNTNFSHPGNPNGYEPELETPKEEVEGPAGSVGCSESTSKVTGDFIAIEAEDTDADLGLWEMQTPTDDWYLGDTQGVAPINNSYLEFTGNNINSGSAQSPLTYTFVCEETATYRLVMRMRQNLEGNGTHEQDKSNDVYVKLEGDFESGNEYTTASLKSNMKFWGRGTKIGNDTVDHWGAIVQGELGHDKLPIMYKLKKGETYTLTMSGRAKGACIDYILFINTKLNLNPGYNVDIAVKFDEKYRPHTCEDNDEPVISDCNTINAVNFDKFTGWNNTFVDAQSGNAPAPANDIQVLSVSNRLKWAAAETTFTGEDGDMLIKLNSMQETDGECTFKVFVNNALIGEVTNDRIHGTGIADYTIQTHEINSDAVSLVNGDVIRVKFNNATNGLVPEGNTTATARGRWVSLELCPAGEAAEDPDPVENELSTIHDAYIQNSASFNNNDLKVEKGVRTAYLLFDTDGLDSYTQSIQLDLTVGDDAGSGELKVYKGNHTNWTETAITAANAPTKGYLLGSIDETYQKGNTYSITLDISKITIGEPLTLIIEQTSGNDVWFSSSEVAGKEPKLVIESATASVDDIDMDSVNVYPNPFVNELVVDLPIGARTIELYDFAGRHILTKNVETGLRTLVVSENVSSLESGAYILQVITETNVYSLKVIKK